jgi:shikimate dehydrogenase
MRRFGLIGKPLTHSFSKQFFTEKFSKENITDCSYELFEGMGPALLGPFLLDHPDIEGLNVTIPYKEEVLTVLDDATQLPIPACNCIKIRNGKLQGFNTDVTGFERSFSPLLRTGQEHALLLGHGGASKAVAYVLQKLGISFRVVSRSLPHHLHYEDLDREILESHTVIINTTPVGTYPKVDEAPPLPYQFIGPDHYLFDLVYNPGKTKFLLEGEKAGATIKNGHEMLVIQAEESWKIWNT